MENKVIHLIDYPPRGTACGLYYPKDLYKEGFGTYRENEVTCQGCLGYLRKRERRNNAITKS